MKVRAGEVGSAQHQHVEPSTPPSNATELSSGKHDRGEFGTIEDSLACRDALHELICIHFAKRLSWEPLADPGPQFGGSPAKPGSGRSLGIPLGSHPRRGQLLKLPGQGLPQGEPPATKWRI